MVITAVLPAQLIAAPRSRESPRRRHYPHARGLHHRLAGLVTSRRRMLADGKCFSLQCCVVEFAEQVDALQAATRVLAEVALRSLDALDGAITLPQFRMLAVLAELGRMRSAGVARALALDASTVTRQADRLVAAGHVVRGSDPRHRSV